MGVFMSLYGYADKVKSRPSADDTFINVSILQFAPFSIFDNCC